MTGPVSPPAGASGTAAFTGGAGAGAADFRGTPTGGRIGSSGGGDFGAERAAGGGLVTVLATLGGAATIATGAAGAGAGTGTWEVGGRCTVQVTVSRTEYAQSALRHRIVLRHNVLPILLGQGADSGGRVEVCAAL